MLRLRPILVTGALLVSVLPSLLTGCANPPAPNTTGPRPLTPHTPAEYREVQQLSLRFYRAQRCGNTGNSLLQSDHFEEHQCHLRDGEAIGLDLNGGWHDAGDYIKFTRTTAWSSYMLLKGFDAFPAQYADQDSPLAQDTANGVPDVLDESRIALDWLARAVISDSQMVTRVGGNQDHDWQYTSPYQSGRSEIEGGGARPVYLGAHADIAGITAAALALGARLWVPHDSLFANHLLERAQTAWRYAQSHPGTTPGSFYPEGSCTWMGRDATYEAEAYRNDSCRGSWIGGDGNDALFCGAAELWRASGDTSLLQTAQSFEQAQGSNGWVMAWDNYWDLGRHTLASAGLTDGLADWRADVARYRSRVAGPGNVEGLAWFADWGSLRFALNAAFSAALLDQVEPQPELRTFALSQLNYLLSDNPYGRSFLTGWGKNPPTHPHHKNSYGLDGGQSWNWGLPYAVPLAGAVVGGPATQAGGGFPAGYQDNGADYRGNEVTIDYNASLPGLAAWALQSK